MSVQNHEKKAFRDMTPEERSSLIEWRLQGGKLQCLSNLGNGDFWAEDCGNCIRFDDTYRTVQRKLEIPWEHIKPEYKWVAMDKSGCVAVFIQKPTAMGGGWISGGYAPIPALNIDTTGIDWRESLTARPEGV